MNKALEIKIESNPSPEFLAKLEDGLNSYNERVEHRWDYSPLYLSLKNSHGDILGGLRGRTLYSWLSVKHLWIHDSVRSEGWGQKLMAAAEEEAKKRSCIGSHVDTYSYQAVGFYMKLGYEVFGELKDCPPGESRVYLRKNL